MTRPPIEAGLRALWPRFVPAGRLDAAYALDSTLQELIWIGGPLLLAVLLAAGNPRLPLLACALTSVTGTAAYAASPEVAAGKQRTAARARSPLRSSRLRVLLAAAGCYGIAAGILNLGLVAYASGYGGAAWAGVLVAVWGAGSLAGEPLTAAGTGRRRLSGGRSAAWRVRCRAALLTAAPGLIVLALLMIPLGVPLSPWLGSLSTYVQRAAPPEAHTEAFTWTFTVITVGMAGGNAAGGTITQDAGTDAAFVIAGVLSLAGAAFGVLWRSRLRDASPVRCPAPMA